MWTFYLGKLFCLPGKITSVGNMAFMTFMRVRVAAMATAAILKRFLVEAANIADDPTAIAQVRTLESKTVNKIQCDF